MNRRLCLAAALALTGLFAAPTHGQQRRPVIDVHMHASPASTAQGIERYLKASGDLVDLPGLRELPPARSNAELLQQSVAAMREHNVVRAVVSGPFLQSYVDAEPTRVIASLNVNPSKLDPQQIRTAFESKRFAVIGELITQFAGISPDDEQLDPLFALATELDVPIGIHMGMAGPGIPTYRARLGNPLLLEEVLAKHPQLRIYVMHAGYPMLDEMIALMQTYPSVYVDTAEINWVRPRASFHRHLRGLVDAGLGKRIMFGSDQMAWPGAIGRGIQAIEEATYLTDAQKRDILCDNAARFLRLSDAICR